MTQVITRFFDSAEQAQKAKYELVQLNWLSNQIIFTYDQPADLAKKLIAKSVVSETAQAYEKRMAKGGVVILVCAGYKPLGVARITRDVTAKHGAADLGALTQEVFVKDPPSIGSSILPNHPHIFKTRREPGSTNYRMANWPIPLIMRNARPANSVSPRGFQLTKFAMPLTNRRKPYNEMIFARHARMAKFPLPLINRRKPFDRSIFPRHARMADRFLPLTNRRKPFSGSVIPRHGRMATVPFPLLIDGETGTNALIPGGPRMANFPIPLLSNRKPFTGSIIPRHARMARFPIGLTSRRKPFTGSMIPRHGRMADMILPLIVRRTKAATKDQETGFSFSKLLGLPTVVRR